MQLRHSFSRIIIVRDDCAALSGVAHLEKEFMYVV